MVDLQDGEVNGFPCLWLSNGVVRLAITTGWGPRILFWGRESGPNLFAEVPDQVRKTPDGVYHFLGGHRLWYAPEVYSRTYWPDEWPISIDVSDAWVTCTAPVDGAGITKELHVALADDRPEVQVRHILRNDGRWSVELGPWALSMCRLGGVALLPQAQSSADADGLLPNRHYNLWPYSDLTDPRLHLGNQITLVYGRPGPANKLGYRNCQGWLAYWIEGTLFVKQFAPCLEAVHPDLNSNAECFIKDRFVELETLGPLARIDPGTTVAHDEVWRLYNDVPPIASEADAVAVTTNVGLWK